MRKRRIFRAAAVCAAVAAAALAFAGCGNPAGGNGNGNGSGGGTGGGWTPSGPGLWAVHGATGTLAQGGQTLSNALISHVNNNTGTEFVLALNAANVNASEVSHTLSPGANLTIVGIGASRTTITFVSNTSNSARLFTVGNGATLTLGNNITLQGRTGHQAALIQVQDGGRLNMRGNSIITGHLNGDITVASGYRGAAIHIASSGTLDMSGTAEISGNRRGGVYMTTGSNFDRTGWIRSNYRAPTGTSSQANVIMLTSHSLYAALNADSRIVGGAYNPVAE